MSKDKIIIAQIMRTPWGRKRFFFPQRTGTNFRFSVLFFLRQLKRIMNVKNQIGDKKTK